jgi:hypothetical protein
MDGLRFSSYSEPNQYTQLLYDFVTASSRNHCYRLGGLACDQVNAFRKSHEKTEKFSENNN